MTREEALALLTRLGSKDDPNLYFEWIGKRDGRPLFPHICVRIDLEVNEGLLCELQKALGGFVYKGRDGVKVEPTWKIQREEAIGLLDPMEQLIFPLERMKTENSKMKAFYAREMLKVWQRRCA